MTIAKEIAAAAVVKKRGRPRKETTATTTAPTVVRKRGRKPKEETTTSSSDTSSAEAEEVVGVVVAAAVVEAVKKKRGRPPKAAAAAAGLGAAAVAAVKNGGTTAISSCSSDVKARKRAAKIMFFMRLDDVDRMKNLVDAADLAEVQNCVIMAVKCGAWKVLKDWCDRIPSVHAFVLGDCMVRDFLRNMAIEYGHAPMVQWLCDHGATAVSWSDFRAAAFFGHVPLMKWMRARVVARPEEEEELRRSLNECILTAVQEGNLAAVHHLCKKDGRPMASHHHIAVRIMRTNHYGEWGGSC